eukprot:15858-Ditylum_brightwellii.AAC.2
MLVKSDISEVNDGPTLIRLILTLLKPTRNIGVQAKIKAIKSAKLSEYGNNLSKMLSDMKIKFDYIKDASGEPVFALKKIAIQAF